MASRSQFGASGSQSATQQTLDNKKSEYEAIAALEQSGAQFISILEEMASDLSTTAEATTAIGKAMEHWSDMCYVLSLTLQNNAQNEDGHTSSSPTNRLVGLPIGQLQPQSEPQGSTSS